MYKLSYFVPATHLEATKEALFDAGAGRIGDYDRCCWQVLGQGQFRPLPGSRPFLGSEGEIETVAEYRVELVVEERLARAAVEALRAAHPYEEPAFDLLRVESL